MSLHRDIFKVLWESVFHARYPPFMMSLTDLNTVLQLIKQVKQCCEAVEENGKECHLLALKCKGIEANLIELKIIDENLRCLPPESLEVLKTRLEESILVINAYNDTGMLRWLRIPTPVCVGLNFNLPLCNCLLNVGRLVSVTVYESIVRSRGFLCSSAHIRLIHVRVVSKASSNSPCKGL